MVLLKRLLTSKIPFNIKIEVSGSSGHSVLRYPEDARSHLLIDVPRGKEWKDSLKRHSEANSLSCMGNVRDTVFYYTVPIVDHRERIGQSLQGDVEQ